MIRKVELRPRAEADLDEIWAHTVEAWSVAQAKAYLTGLGASLELIAEFPDLARLRVEFTPAVRIHPYKKHLIIFQSDETVVDVLRIVHSRRNWSDFLAD
ncbi:type II toxin-antitoxin system RelE/ParE family toxin [Ruegeria hyattellae]|uniref:type II toxin-antitoxin system RelE/ParE family toxin n=1 Tax=Ruegeria hyattellae TaxID=3233337 RepID=UPI00355B14CE